MFGSAVRAITVWQNMTGRVEDKLPEMQARLDEQSRTLEATTKQLQEERVSRRGGSVEAGKEPGSPTIAVTDKEKTLSGRFVEQQEVAETTSSSATL